jgi:hypothetical protein
MFTSKANPPRSPDITGQPAEAALPATEEVERPTAPLSSVVIDSSPAPAAASGARASMHVSLGGDVIQVTPSSSSSSSASSSTDGNSALMGSTSGSAAPSLAASAQAVFASMKKPSSPSWRMPPAADSPLSREHSASSFLPASSQELRAVSSLPPVKPPHRRMFVPSAPPPTSSSIRDSLADSHPAQAHSEPDLLSNRLSAASSSSSPTSARAPPLRFQPAPAWSLPSSSAAANGAASTNTSSSSNNAGLSASAQERRPLLSGGGGGAARSGGWTGQAMSSSATFARDWPMRETSSGVCLFVWTKLFGRVLSVCGVVWCADDSWQLQNADSEEDADPKLSTAYVTRLVCVVLCCAVLCCAELWLGSVLSPPPQQRRE